jgi:sterol desaturase/sphingolipid hydroxylase (fatty acid hydroxylase superfamily)
MNPLRLALFAMLTTPLLYPFMPRERVFLGYMASAFIPVAFIAWRRNGWRRDFAAVWETCFPKAVWKHPSTKLDFQYFFVNTALFTVMAVPYIGGSGFSRAHAFRLFEALFGRPEHQLPVTALGVIGVTLLLALLVDFALFLAHWLQHRVPFLWEFHKVHHSAQVMTPITVYRMHPVDDVLALFMGGVFTGLGLGAAQYLFEQQPTVVVIAGQNFCTFAFYLAFYNLRHSHFWLHYPGVLGRLFISPAQHQIHHSSEQRHWNRNYGFILGIWDWMFRCHYVPVEKEEFTLGIGEETHEFNSVKALYLLPFRKNWSRLRKLWHKQPHE